MNHQNSEKGQALIVIALAAVVLFGFAALSIDGSMVFSDRRHAQNAADTAVLDAALAKTRGGDWNAEGLDRAASNSYNNNGATNFVYLYNPPVDGKYQGDIQYVQVKITSIVSTRFARIIGVSQITNNVAAVARSVPGSVSPLFAGNAVVSLAPHECKAMTLQGTTDTRVIGSGLFVNSDCANAAFFNNSGSADLTAPCINAVGGITANSGSVHTGGCLGEGATSYNYPPDNMVFPNPVCPSGTSQNGNTLNPGTYSGHFPPNGVTHLNGGIYCVNGDFRVNGGDTLTGDEVLIVMQSGNISFMGGADIQLTGIPGPRSESNQLGGLLFYMPMSNSGTITINGNSESSFVGTILAPAADVSIEGTGDQGLNGQIIGYTVDFTGTSGSTITYNEAQNWQAPVPPQIELTQ